MSRSACDNAAPVEWGIEPNDRDVTGDCKTRRHGKCSSVLLAATGPHWFCACPCHPMPTEADCSPFADPKSVAIALNTLRVAREKITGRPLEARP